MMMSFCKKAPGAWAAECIRMAAERTATFKGVNYTYTEDEFRGLLWYTHKVLKTGSHYTCQHCSHHAYTKERMMEHLMANHGWKKPCPLMLQGSKSLVEQLVSQESWEKIARNWLTTSTKEERRAEETSSPPTRKRQAADAVKPTTKRQREDKHGLEENPFAGERKQSVKWADDLKRAGSSSASFFIDPHLSRDQVKRMAEEYVDNLLFLPKVNKPPDLIPCPLLLQILSPTIMGVEDYGEDYIERMQSMLVDGTLKEETFLQHVQNFVGSLDGEEAESTISMAIKVLVPLFSRYRTYLRDDIEATFKETTSFCSAYLAQSLWEKNNFKMSSMVGKLKHFLVELKLTEHDLLQPFFSDLQDADSFIKSCPDWLSGDDQNICMPNCSISVMQGCMQGHVQGNVQGNTSRIGSVMKGIGQQCNDELVVLKRMAQKMDYEEKDGSKEDGTDELVLNLDNEEKDVSKEEKDSKDELAAGMQENIEEESEANKLQEDGSKDELAAGMLEKVEEESEVNPNAPMLNHRWQCIHKLIPKWGSKTSPS